MEAEAAAATPAAPIPVETVYRTLEAALSFDNATRSAAERQLRDWEGDAAPGFIGSLLKVVAEVAAVPEEGRLMAAVVAKNAVGSSWRKTIGSREWSRVPDDEKAYIRATAMASLLGDPSDRVALQVTLLVTNIARFDAPLPWQSLLPDLMAAAAEESPVAPPGKRRALRAIKHVLQALKNKKFVVSAPTISRAMSEHEFEELASGIQRQRRELDAQCKALLVPLRQQWEQHTAALLAGGPGWERHGAASAATLLAIRELMHVLQDFDSVEDAFTALFTELHQAAAAIAPQVLSGPMAAAAVAAATAEEAGGALPPGADPQQAQRWQLLTKNWERLLQVALVTMDRHTFHFAAHLPPFMSLCINAALLAMDASLVHRIRPKARVVLVRFCARALLQQLYRRDFVQGASPEARYLSDVGREAIERHRAALLAAADALDAILAPAQCPQLVQAIIQKYIMLSPDEVAEWEADPESFARNVDVETSPDADTPRPCGVALLECMLERADEPVAAALLAMAAQQQAAQLSPENILMREGTYRAIGECFPHLRTKVDFGAWYGSELRLILTSTDLTGLHGSILRAGALWLIGVCGGELQPAPWAEACVLTVQHVAHADVVVALMAVSALTVLLSNTLEESQFVAAPAQRKRLILEGPLAALQGPADSEDEAADSLAAQVDAEFHAHMAAVDGQTDAIIAGCFGLLPRLGEIESMVRVLQCVSSAVELLGDRLRPHLATICAALPQVWQVISQRRQEGAGGLARLHSALISTVTHLLVRLGSAAVADPGVAALLFPLLQHATNLGSPDSEPLVDDGLRLWTAVLATSEQLPAPLQELFVQRLPPILRRGQDNTSCLKIAEGHALLGGLPAVAPLLPQLAAAITRSLTAMLAAAAAGQQRIAELIAASSLPAAQRSREQQQQNKGLTADLAAEGTAAAILLTLLVQLVDQAAAAAAAAGSQPATAELPAELEPAAKAAAAVSAADFGGGVVRLPSAGVGLVEACLEVVARLLYRQPALLPALLDGSSDNENRLLDRWVILGGARDIAEMFVPAMGALGRTRRHRAAVTICSLLYADACPPLRTPERAAQALALGVRAAREQETFARDQQRLAELQVTDAAHSDQLVLRRLAVAREDPIRAVDAREAVKAAAAKVASWMGEEQLQQRMEQADPTAAEQLQRLRNGQPMQGGGGGGSTDNGSSDLNGGDGMMLRPGSSTG